MKYKKIIILLLIIFVIFILLGPLQIQKKVLMKIYPKEYEEIVDLNSEKYNVDKNLIFAIIKAESNFNEKAHSSKGANGLMQLMESTAKDVLKGTQIQITDEELEEKIFDVNINIELGTKYISTLIEKYESIEIALTAYNAGIGTVNNWIEKGILKSDGSDIENIPYKETNTYVRKILRDYKIYEDLYG